MQRLESDLRARGYTVEQLDGGQLVATRSWFKLRWMATKLTLFIVVKTVDHIDEGTVYAHVGKAQALSAARWQGLRGMQQGYCVIPLLLGRTFDASAVQALGDRWSIEFSKFTVPAFAVPGEFKVPRPPRFMAIIYHGFIKAQLGALAGIATAGDRSTPQPRRRATAPVP